MCPLKWQNLRSSGKAIIKKPAKEGATIGKAWCDGFNLQKGATLSGKLATQAALQRETVYMINWTFSEPHAASVPQSVPKLPQTSPLLIREAKQKALATA